MIRQVCFVKLRICSSQERKRLISKCRVNAWLQLFWLLLLFAEKGEMLELCPHEVGFIGTVSEDKPRPAGNEACYHAGIIASAYIGSQPLLIL